MTRRIPLPSEERPAPGVIMKGRSAVQLVPLYAVAFTSGAVMMCLQLAGARLLAPVMGNSIFVWGSVISSFMSALAAGYWLGGVLADRYGARRTLGIAVGLAGL
ncbi:MAG TPA: hypothetical protein VFH17_00525, partial [Coriobacteriia bacterium]|nr:hypothetical protein [Coriobacteriia bacterium]